MRSGELPIPHDTSSICPSVRPVFGLDPAGAGERVTVPTSSSVLGLRARGQGDEWVEAAAPAPASSSAGGRRSREQRPHRRSDWPGFLVWSDRAPRPLADRRPQPPSHWPASSPSPGKATDRVRLASSSPAPPAARPSAVCPAAAPWSLSGRKPILERWRQIGRAEVALPPRRAGERPRPSDRPVGRALSLLSWKGKPSSAPRRAAGRESSSQNHREKEEEGRRRKGSAWATIDEVRRQRPRGLEETGLPRRRCKTGERKTISTRVVL